MKFNLIKILDACTMIFPFLAWKKHRNRSTNIVHKLMRLHIPISTLFHCSEAFLHKKSKILNIFKHLDIFFIHLSFLAGNLSVIKKFFPNKNKLIKIIWFSGILHIHSFYINYKYDNGTYRAYLLLANTFPIIIYKNYNTKKIITHSLIAYELYSLNEKILIGHSAFHVMLYKIYDDYFII